MGRMHRYEDEKEEKPEVFHRDVHIELFGHGICYASMPVPVRMAAHFLFQNKHGDFGRRIHMATDTVLLWL